MTKSISFLAILLVVLLSWTGAFVVPPPTTSTKQAPASSAFLLAMAGGNVEAIDPEDACKHQSVSANCVLCCIGLLGYCKDCIVPQAS